MRKTVAIRDTIEENLRNPGPRIGEKLLSKNAFSVRRKIAKAGSISERTSSQSEIQKGEIISDKLFSEGVTVEDRKSREQGHH